MSRPDQVPKRRSVWIIVFLSLVLLSRLPLLGGGYGSDNDAWRNAVAGAHMRQVGHYVPSRPPGFPVFEVIVATLVPWGWKATNGAAILAGTAAVAIFLVLTRRRRVAAPQWLAGGFAFSAATWVFMSQTMDYAFGVAFALGGYLAFLTRRYVWAGVLLALAAGCRPTNGALVLAASLALAARGETLRAWAQVLGSYLPITAAIFLPVALSPELGDLRRHAALHIGIAHVTPATLLPVIRGAVVFCLGKLGVIILALGLAIAGLARFRPPLDRGAEGAADPGATTFEASAVVLIGALFLLVPYESAYLLPAVPFGLLLVARVLSRRWIAVLALALALESLALPLLAERRIVPGWVFVEIDRRQQLVAETRTLASLGSAAPTVYVVGRFQVHRLLLLEPGLERLAAAWAPFRASGVALWGAGRRAGYAVMLTVEERAALERDGYTVVDLPADDTTPQPIGSPR